MPSMLLGYLLFKVANKTQGFSKIVLSLIERFLHSGRMSCFSKLNCANLHLTSASFLPPDFKGTTTRAGQWILFLYLLIKKLPF